MAAQVEAADAGATAYAMLARAAGSADVVAVFRRAVYLRMPGGALLALTDRAVPRGPLHVRLPTLPCLHQGQQVRLGPGASLSAGDLLVRLVPPGWSGPRPSVEGLLVARECAARLDVDAHLPPPLDGRSLIDRLVATVQAADLLGVAGLVGGLGPGLTPAGDDVLAGVLFVAALAAPPSDRAGLLAVVRAARTNDISAAFLGCAAAGQSIEPAHDLVCALAGQDLGSAARAQDELTRFGASSGQAMVYGIVLALGSLPAVTRTGT